MEAESLEVIDTLKQQISSTMSSLRNCRTKASASATSSKKTAKEGRDGDVLEAAEEALRKEVSRLREALDKSQKRARANVQGLQDVQDKHEQELRVSIFLLYSLHFDGNDGAEQRPLERGGLLMLDCLWCDD